MASLRAPNGSERILNKLSKLIESHEYYEAHQLYRTIYFRYTNAKRFRELQDLLFNGASILLKCEQYNSGADVAVLFIDSLSQDPCLKDVLKEPSECEKLGKKIGQLMSMIPEGTPERLNFTLTALKQKPTVFPIPLIHREFAIATWHEKNYTDSRYHFLHCSYESGEECAKMLIEYHISCGYPSEADLFIAQFILQLLCLKKINFNPPQTESKPWYTLSYTNDGASSNSLGNSLNLAKIIPKSNQHAFAYLTLRYYLAKHPQIRENDPPFIMPLINFLWFLLLVIDSGSSSLFTVLCDVYGTVLIRDPAFKEYLKRIGEIYFGIRPPPTNRGLGGFLSNFLQSFMEDNEEEMEEDINRNPSTRGAASSGSNEVNTQNVMTRSEDLD